MFPLVCLARSPPMGRRRLTADGTTDVLPIISQRHCLRPGNSREILRRQITKKPFRYFPNLPRSNLIQPLHLFPAPGHCSTVSSAFRDANPSGLRMHQNLHRIPIRAQKKGVTVRGRHETVHATKPATQNQVFEFSTPVWFHEPSSVFVDGSSSVVAVSGRCPASIFRDGPSVVRAVRFGCPA